MKFVLAMRWHAISLLIWHTFSSASGTVATAFTSDVLEHGLEKDDCPDSMRLLQWRSEQRLENRESQSENSGKGCNQEILDLSGRGLTTWPWTELTHCPSLQILDLSNNFLEDVPTNAFANTSNLRILRLSMNRIASFPAVASLTKLWELDLSFNNIETLPSGALMENRELTTLNLRHNKLTVLPSFTSWIERQNELNFLVLASNQISSIGSSTTGVLDSLDWLDLSNNKLSYLKADFVRDVQGVDNLILIGNPFSCRGINDKCTTGSPEDQMRFALPVNWCKLPVCDTNSTVSDVNTTNRDGGGGNGGGGSGGGVFQGGS